MMSFKDKDLRFPDFKGLFEGDLLEDTTKGIREFIDLFEDKKSAKSDIEYRTNSDKDTLTLYFHVPGLKREDISIGMLEDVLTVELESNYYYKMFGQSSLPSAKISLKIKDHVNIDTLSAKLDAGILTIEFIKKPIPVKPEKKIIEIK